MKEGRKDKIKCKPRKKKKTGNIKAKNNSVKNNVIIFT